MKKYITLLIIFFSTTSLLAQDKVLYQSLGDIGKGSSENGWVLQNVAFSFKAFQKYNYEGKPAKKVYWYDGNGKVTYKMEGYQYKGKYYNKSALYNILGYSIVGSSIKIKVSFNKLFPDKERSSDGTSSSPYYISTNKKSSPGKIDDLKFTTTKITYRRASHIESAIEQHLKKEKKKKEEKDKPKKTENKDDFWNGGEEKTTKTKKNKIKTETNNDDFWSGESTTTNTNSDDGFWSGEKVEQKTELNNTNKSVYPELERITENGDVILRFKKTKETIFRYSADSEYRYHFFNCKGYNFIYKYYVGKKGLTGNEKAQHRKRNHNEMKLFNKKGEILLSGKGFQDIKYIENGNVTITNSTEDLNYRYKDLNGYSNNKIYVEKNYKKPILYMTYYKKYEDVKLRGWANSSKISYCTIYIYDLNLNIIDKFDIITSGWIW